MELFVNNVPTTLTSAVTSTSQTSFTIADGTSFPKVGNYRLLIGTEIVLVTAVTPSSGTNYAPCTLTVTRGVEGTATSTYSSGTRIDTIVTAQALHNAFDTRMSTNTAANLPINSAVNEGDMFVPSDSFYSLVRFNGATWDWFYNGRKLTPPNFNSYGVTWFTDSVDQNLTLDFSTKAGVMWDPGGNYSIRSKLRPVPSTPYTMTIAINPHFYYNTYANVGMLWKAAGVPGSGPYILWGIGASGGGATIRGYYWSTPSNFNGEFYNIPCPPMLISGPLTWLRMADNGVNKTGSISSNGVNWTQCWSMSHANYITPAYIGVQLSDNQNNNMGQTIVHMEFS